MKQGILANSHASVRRSSNSITRANRDAKERASWTNDVLAKLEPLHVKLGRLVRAIILALTATNQTQASAGHRASALTQHLKGSCL